MDATIENPKSEIQNPPDACPHDGLFEPTVDIKTSGAARITTVTALRCAKCGAVFTNSGHAAATGSIVWLYKPPAPPPATLTPAQFEANLRAELGEGPGTELAIDFFRRGIPSCQACKDLARKMNAWGVAGCREHMDEIVDDMLPRFRDWIANERKWANRLFKTINIVGAGDAAARVAIRAYVNNLLDRYEQQTADGSAAA